MNLISERLAVADYDEAVERFDQRNRTDRPPMVLPTRSRMEAMIALIDEGAAALPAIVAGPLW